jgi:hypothetical protein
MFQIIEVFLGISIGIALLWVTILAKGCATAQ